MAATKLGPHLKELRILLCQTSKSSQGASSQPNLSVFFRDFVSTQYVPLKKQNPNLPILIRECSSTEPFLYARYEYGVEECVSLQNLKPAEILKRIEELASSKPK